MLTVRSFIATAFLAGLAGCQTSQSVSSRSGDLADAGGKSSVLLRLAETDRATGNCPAATDFYNKALTAKADPVAVHIGLGACMISTGALDGADREFRLAAGLAPQRPEPQAGLARIALDKGDIPGALAIVDRAAAAGIHGPDLSDVKGVSLDLLRHHTEAQTAYREGLVAAPRDPELRNNLALSLAMSGRFADSLLILQTLAQEPAAGTRTRQNLALVLGWSGDMESARLVAGRDLKPTDVENNVRFYEALRRNGDAPSGS